MHTHAITSCFSSAVSLQQRSLGILFFFVQNYFFAIFNKPRALANDNSNQPDDCVNVGWQSTGIEPLKIPW
jgi:hypothetical protein